MPAFAMRLTLGLAITAATVSASSVWESVKVEACRGMAPTKDICQWRMRTETTQCSAEKPCSKLVIFFSGGNMSCMDRIAKWDRGLGAVLKRYSQDGYVAVCAQAYESSDNAAVPFVDVAPRADAMVTSIVTSPSVRKLWTGEDLLIAGVSHGAGTPPVAMARNDYDDKKEWKGTRTTAACLHDGSYDSYALDRAFRADSTCRKLRNRVICSRYGMKKDCAFPVPQNEKMDGDTIVKVDPSVFAIKTWKLIECGSKIAAPRCALFGDWLPKESIEALCKRIDGSPNHSCEYDSLPQGSHIMCSVKEDGIDKCRLWFNAKVRG